jgi:hypothetical protein
MSDSDDDSLEFFDAVDSRDSAARGTAFCHPQRSMSDLSEALSEVRDFVIPEGDEDESDEDRSCGKSDTDHAPRLKSTDSRSDTTVDSSPLNAPASGQMGFNSTKTGFGSSIRSLFGGFSNNNDADDVISDSDEQVNRDYGLVSTRSNTREEKKDTDSQDNTSLDNDDTTPGETSKHPSDKDSEERPLTPTPEKASSQSWGSTVWNYFLSRSGGASPGSAALPASRREEKKRGVKVHLSLKKQPTYQQVSVMQELDVHHGPVWVMRFSRDGYFLATGGQDGKAIIWSVGIDRRESCLVNIDDEEQEERTPSAAFTHGPPSPAPGPGPGGRQHDARHADAGSCFIFPTPCRVYGDHDGHIIDLSWSASNFLITACLDKMVRLWHVKRWVQGAGSD